jgi:serine/threonine protein phosphatase PrpC
MSLDTGTQADVVPCRACGSPVFDDELHCEACGTRVAGELTAPRAAAARQPAERQEQDLGAMAAITDRGHRRQRNEDTVAIAAGDGRFVAVVCDGVASTANPDQAARAATDAARAVLEPLLSSLPWPDPATLEELVGEAFAQAQAAVILVPDDEPEGNDLSPSTTLVLAVATPERIVVGNIGDSRAYWLSSVSGESRTLTVDDSWAQERIAEGTDPAVAYGDPDAHTITRWIGGDAESVVPTVVRLELAEPGVLVVCTDGLWNYFEDPERLAELVPSGQATPMEIARSLTDAALEAGGQDNITVAVVPLDPASGGPGASQTEEVRRHG